MSRPVRGEVFLGQHFLASAKNTSELGKRLEAAVSYLQALEQAEEGPDALPPGLENLAADLVSGPVLGSRNKVLAVAVWSLPLRTAHHALDRFCRTFPCLRAVV